MNLSLNRIKSQNQMTNIYIGSALLILSILDVFLNSFFRINISGSLPGNLSIFFPLILGFLGLSYLRTEYSGYKFLDSLNKNINTTNFFCLSRKLNSLKNPFRTKTAAKAKEEDRAFAVHRCT